MSAAARNLGISPAMVSKRMARLESRLGVRLLDRTTRTLDATARGRRFFEDLVQILETISKAEARATDGTAVPEGPLRITAPTSFGRLHLAPCIEPFLELFPGVDLWVELSDGFTDILRDNFDLAIRITSVSSPSLVAHRLAENSRVLCASPGYLKSHGTPASMSDLGKHNFLAAEGQSPWQLIGPDGRLSLDVKSRVRTNSSELIRELTVAGLGIALRSLWDVSEELASGDLVRVLPDVRGSDRAGIYAVHPRGRLSSGAAALLEFLRQRWTPDPFREE